MDREICPPSKKATGIRFSMVTTIPTQPANATGCICSIYPSGTFGAEKKLIIVNNNGGLKINEPVFNGATLDRYIPINNTGMVTTMPARGPLAPRSKRAFLVGIGDLTFITAPKVPIRVGAGMK